MTLEATITEWTEDRVKSAIEILIQRVPPVFDWWEK